MRLNLLAFILLFTASFTGQAQDKKFTIQDAVGGYHLYPKSISQLQWIDDVSYSNVKEGDGSILEMHSLSENASRAKLLSTKDLDGALAKFEAEYDKDSDTLKRFPSVHWIDADHFRFYRKGQYLRYSIKTQSLEHVIDRSTSMGNMDFHEASNQIAYTEGNNLFVQSKDGSKPVTSDGEGAIVYGQAVHRFEFGIRKGTFWSPNGSVLAFYRKDESMVTQYPMYELNDTPATSKSVYYPTAGAASHHASVGLYNVASAKIVYLKTKGPKERYLTNISWGPNSKFIYVAEVNRGQNHMWLNQYNAESGEFVKTLFEEKNDRYVEPEHAMVFLKRNDDKFVWWSERDGWNHLYLYNTNGELLKQLTKGEWIVTSFLGWDTNQENLFVVSTAENGIERHVYCISEKSGKMKKLTDKPGMHRVSMNASKTLFIDRFTNTTNPGEVEIRTAEGKTARAIYKSKNPLKEYELSEMTIGSMQGEDGQKLYYRLFKPTNFDPNKKYPVVVYLYNGPHLQLVTNSWNGGANNWYHYMAQKGYAVFSIDGRGSADRGFNFESVVHRQLGTLEMNDQLRGIDYLKGLSWVDTSRLGIHGWSYGGFMTTSLMSRHPGVFKVGVAGGPVIDWQYYEIMYTERYMDSPQENPEGYKINSLLNHVENLEGKLLMIHGGQDQTVLWQHSLLYLKKAISKGVQLDYFVYPHHAHNVRGPERVHLYEKVSQYFFDYL
jgi:dipeptidyl-peptidase 4